MSGGMDMGYLVSRNSRNYRFWSFRSPHLLSRNSRAPFRGRGKRERGRSGQNYSQMPFIALIRQTRHYPREKQGNMGMGYRGDIHSFAHLTADPHPVVVRHTSPILLKYNVSTVLLDNSCNLFVANSGNYGTINSM